MSRKAKTASSNLHVGIIMDGNGRWATARGLPRSHGHRAGVKAIEPILEAAPEMGVGVLTLYAFSSDNWRRPRPEVGMLMGLLRDYLDRETRNLAEKGVRLTVIGRRDRLPDGLARAIAEAEEATAEGRKLHLRVGVDYSGRHAILEAARQGAAAGFDAETFSRMVTGDPNVVDVDLIIRTGGEQRLSDFLLWECAYAELFFTDCMWPDFSPAELRRALESFYARERRFGGLAPSWAAA